MLGNNMFAYCNGNPIRFSDHTGHAVWELSTFAVLDGGSRRRDVTDEVLAALEDTVSYAKAKHASSNMNIFEIIEEFYNLVNHEAPWDIKRQQPWENTIGTTYPGYEAQVLFCGEIMTPEMIGNFTYGYLGFEYGFSLDILYGGSYYAAGFPVFDVSGLENELNDWEYIKKGYMYAKSEYIKGVIG